jgi:hypothetical protein
MNWRTRRTAAWIAPLALLALAACGGGNDSDAAAAATLPADASARADAKAPTAEAPTPETVAPVVPQIRPVDDVEDTGVMPDVMCLDLQLAQDTIQAAGVFLSDSRDAIPGLDREQMWDRHWQVVAQWPTPGTPVGETEAMLDVVKFGEPSPS